jgi:hypothetical protein
MFPLFVFVGFGIRDGKKPGSGINIRDPQHCYLDLNNEYFHCFSGMLSSLWNTWGAGTCIDFS